MDEVRQEVGVAVLSQEGRVASAKRKLDIFALISFILSFFAFVISGFC